MSESNDEAVARMRVHRPAASAVWEHTHRWGPMLGDSTDLRVTRTADGPLTIAYGKESIDIRRDLVDRLAAMVAAAAASWTDTPQPPDHDDATGASA